MQNQTENEALISIALCTYNGERFLADQLRSITNQTYQNLEIIVVDDCSTDKTVDILESAQKSDPRIKIYKNKKNLGFIKNFEKALRICNGDFIALSDQDDIWFPQKVQTLRNQIGDNLLIYSSVHLIDEHDHPLPGSFPKLKPIEGKKPLSLILGNCVIGHTCLIKKELLDSALPIPENIFAHDQWLAIISAAHGKLKYSGEILSLYRSHQNNAIFKKKNKENKKEKAESTNKKVEKLLYLSEKTIKSGTLTKQETQKLIDFQRLLKKNTSTIYNFDLNRFLKENSEDFLGLYKNKKKKIKKQCRGYWYYKLMPFS